ncbi:hypothetical protein MS6207_00802 [Escherichia coli]|nr:terminase [Escherichia coli]ARX57859.1 terminase [Escherichia coli]NUV02668.1 hypothetical protein [Escherichia coli]NUV16629.1 hypothetical protein [Escherichia coli]NUV24178.1 hypothetical protein [Escherichia coli]
MSRKSYPNVNAANQYARDVVRGKIVACQFVIQACQRHLDDLMAEKSKSFRYRFDKDLAERAAKFIQLLPHTKGEWAFKRMPITLEPWQLFVICCAFGWVNKGIRLRRFREVYTEIPRKNGKSAISAGVALYCFACDNEFGAEVYSGATTEKQAWEVFRPARLMCKRTPMLTEAFGIEVNASNMNRPEDGARFEPLIGNPGDGSSPHCAVVDEYHEHATDALYTTMLTGMGARRQPLMWAITTAGYNIEGPCYDKRREVIEMLNGSVPNDELFGIIYTVDEGDDWTDPQVLEKANPEACGNPITYDGGTLLDLNRHELIYQFDFSVISELTEDDTRQQDDLNSLDELRTLAIDVDYLDPGNGPDGDIEHHTEITLPS